MLDEEKYWAPPLPKLIEKKILNKVPRQDFNIGPWAKLNIELKIKI